MRAAVATSYDDRMALDPLNPFDDAAEQVWGPFEEKEMTVWRDRNGQYHRADGAAVEYKTGRKIWMLHGRVVTEAKVAAYRQKLEAERAQRLKAEKARQIEADAAEFHAGLDRDIVVKKSLPKPRKKR